MITKKKYATGSKVTDWKNFIEEIFFGQPGNCEVFDPFQETDFH